MKKLIISIFALTLTTSIARATEEYEVPSAALLEAAMTLSPSTGPAYSASGILTCTSISNEFPPYGSSRDCVVMLNEGSISMRSIDGLEQSSIDGLIEALMEIKPALGPSYSVTAEFVVQSINSGWAPATSSAKIQLD